MAWTGGKPRVTQKDRHGRTVLAGTLSSKGVGGKVMKDLKNARSQSASAGAVKAAQDASKEMRKKSDEFRAVTGKKPLKPGAEYQAARRKARRELLEKQNPRSKKG